MSVQGYSAREVAGVEQSNDAPAGARRVRGAIEGAATVRRHVRNKAGNIPTPHSAPNTRPVSFLRPVCFLSLSRSQPSWGVMLSLPPARLPLQRRRSAAPAATSVFLCSCPLVGLEVAGELLGPAYPAALQHAFLVTACQSAVTAHDFLPLHPTAPATALALLAGGAPGELRSRRLASVPRRRCRLLGCVRPELLAPGAESEAVEAVVAAFGATWDTRLVLGRHDCRAYALELGCLLTGVEPG